MSDTPNPSEPVAGPWRVSTVKASKARRATRIWALGPNRQSVGWFFTAEEAQAYCDERNAKLKESDQ